MAQDTTKLCEFSNTNNNDFDINASLLNLIMKDQFSESPNEDAASRLNTFGEVCDMQKKKDMDNDIVK